MNSESYDLSFDRPLQNSVDDRLGFYSFAETIASVVLRHLQGDGLVIGLNGKWGTGKSTILNFIEISVKDKVRVVRFNPWFFSGRENLAGLLLSQLSAEIDPNKKSEIRNAIANLIDVASSFSVGGVGVNPKIITDKLRNPQSLDKIKKGVDKLLTEKQTPILVLIDDVDRLVSEEIRDIFRAVKAVASLPYVSYLIAFDSSVVIDALNESSQGHGAEYLEKIVQVQFPVPAIEQFELRTILFSKLDLIIASTKTPEPDKQEWANIYYNGLDPLIKTPRAVNRILNIFSATYPVVAGEVVFIDFFCIECIRAVEPALYESLKYNAEILTDSIATDSDKSKRRERIESWLNSVSVERREPIRYIVFYLFPSIVNSYSSNFAIIQKSAAARELPSIGNADFFPIYFRFAIDSDSIATSEVRRIIGSAVDRSEFASNLLPLAKCERKDGTTKAKLFLERMLMYAEKDIPTSDIENILLTLFDVGDSLNVEQDSGRGSLEFGNDLKISRIARKLMGRISKPEQCRILKKAISEGQSVSVASEMVVTIAWQYGEMTSHPADREEERLIDKATYSELKTIMAKKIEEKAKKNELFQMIDFPHLLWVWEDWCAEKDNVKAWINESIRQDDQLACFLVGFVGTSRSWGMGDVIAKETRVVQFDSLSHYIDLEQTHERLLAIKTERCSDREKEAITLFISQYRKRDE